MRICIINIVLGTAIYSRVQFTSLQSILVAVHGMLSILHYSTVEYNKVWYTTKYSRIQYRSVEYNTVEYNILQYSVEQCQDVCRGMWRGDFLPGRDPWTPQEPAAILQPWEKPQELAASS